MLYEQSMKNLRIVKKGRKLMKRIGIVGGGSLGLLLGSFLTDDFSVTIYVKRDEQKLQLQKHGIVRDTVNAFVSVERFDQMDQEDLLLIAVKQYHLDDVMSYINKSNHKTPLIFLQNGMGHLNQLKKLKQPTIVGVVEHGAYRVNDYTVKHTGKGQIKVAAYTSGEHLVREIQKRINRPNFKVTIHADWEKLLVEKLMINAVINPLTALLNIRNGELLTNKNAYTLLKHLTEEVADILGLNFNEALARVKKIATLTAQNKSSMLQDIETTGRTEIDAILGYVLQLPSQREKQYTTFAYHSIKALEYRGM